MISLWLSKQGSICPLTGQPLVSAELRGDDKAKMEVQEWYKGLLLEKQKKAAASSGDNNRAINKPTVETDKNGKQSSSYTRGGNGESPSSRGDRRCDARRAFDAKAPPKDDKECQGPSDGSGDGRHSVSFDGRKEIDGADEDGLYEF